MLTAALLSCISLSVEAVTVTDLAGRTVNVPDQVQRIVLGEGRLIYTLSMLEGKNLFARLAGWQGDFRHLDVQGYAAYRKVFPQAEQVPLVGATSADSFSVEKALSLRPDLAVGCTYKYLNGGPGSPAFIWVPEQHQARFRQPLSGWWGHAAPFAMEPGFAPADGIARALCGTQPIVSLALVECGLEIFAQTSMEAIRRKSLALTELFIALVEQRCASHPLGLVTPREHARRGSQVSFTHPHGYAVMQALIARGVIGDYREPAIMRFGFTPLYTSFADVWDAVEILRDILDTQAYDIAAKRDAVT